MVALVENSKIAGMTGLKDHRVIRNCLHLGFVGQRLAAL